MKLKRSTFSEISSIFFCIFLILIDKYVTENLLYTQSVGYDFHVFILINFINNADNLCFLVNLHHKIYSINF